MQTREIMNTSFNIFTMRYELEVIDYQKVHLSIPALQYGEALKPKDLLNSGDVSADGKYNLEQHLQLLVQNQRIKADTPLLVLGMRNSLVNLRCPVIIEGQVYAVEGEHPKNSARPYYGIGLRNNRFVCDRVMADYGSANDWQEFFCAGVPVLWDDLEPDVLFETLLCEAADHSHIFNLPRGNHPEATDFTRNAWQSLQNTFLQNLHADAESATQAMLKVLADVNPPLSRANDYLHAVLGTRPDGSLVAIFAQEQLENLGAIMKHHGCIRAVCVENSGSVMPTFLPKGASGESIALLRAPNFRSRGRALMVIELNNSKFACYHSGINKNKSTGENLMSNQFKLIFNELSPYIPLTMLGEYKNAANIEILLQENKLKKLLIQDMLKDIVKRQIDFAKSKLKLQQFDRLPKYIESLAQENIQVLGAVSNMLEAFEYFMKEDEHEDIRRILSGVFEPIIVNHNDFYSLTSPALLVIHSILLSHCDSREETTEQYSAVRAYEELIAAECRPLDCRFITAIIAHQTLLRAAWSVDPINDPPEVTAYYLDDGKFKRAKNIEQHSKVGFALQRTLFPFIESTTAKQDLSNSKKMQRRNQLAAALILHCLCLQCRHSSFAAKPESSTANKLKTIKAQALSFSYHLCELSSQPPTGLVFFHYLRYANLDRGTGDKSLYKATMEWLEEKLKCESEKDFSFLKDKEELSNFTVCFPRVPSKQFWLSADFNKLEDNSIIPQEKNWIEPLYDANAKNVQQLNNVIALVGATVGEKVWEYQIKKEDFLLTALGLKNIETSEIIEWLNSKTVETAHTLKLLGTLFNAVLETHITDYENYFPAPQIGHILKQLHLLRPSYFVPMHIICRDINDGNKLNKKLFTIWLPKEISWFVENNWHDKELEVDDDKVYIWGNDRANCLAMPEILIARYVAAMLITKAVSFASREIGLDYYSKEAREFWGILIDCAIRENGAHVMQVYTTMINCLPSRFYRYEVLPEYSETKMLPDDFVKTVLENNLFQDKYILGIDIGGTALKAYRFSVESLLDAKKTFTPHIKKVIINDVATLKEPVNEYDANEFVEKLFDQIFAPENKIILPNCKAIGFSLAAPVDKNTGVPTGACRALGTYFKAQTEVIKANPMDLHRINLKKAVAKYLTESNKKSNKVDAEQMVVTVLNDGDADIKDSSARSQIEEGVSVVVKAGTGVAVAVFENSKQIGYKAESAKAVLNILTNVQAKPINERFQEGVLGRYCSKTALIELMKNFKSNKKEDENDGKVINELLRQALDGSKADDSDEDKEILDKIKEYKDSITFDLLENIPDEELLELYTVVYNQYYFESQVSDLCGFVVSSLIVEQKIALCNTINSIFKEKIKQPFTYTNIGTTKNLLKNAIASQYTTALDKLGNFLKDIEAKMGDDYPLKTYKSQYSSEIDISEWNMKKLAVAVCYILGKWLADAIALVVDTYDAKEIQLGGGPLAGFTGIFVTTAARIALEEAYGFDIQVFFESEQQTDKSTALSSNGRYKSRDLKTLRLIYPPLDSGIGGARGAAKAALEDWVQITKQKQLLDCRDHVAQVKKSGDIFTAERVLNQVFSQLKSRLINKEEVENMLVTESVSLDLIRIASSTFKKLDLDV